MPPGDPNGYEELLRLLEGEQAPADAGLGFGGVATAGGLAAGGALAARRFAPTRTAAAAEKAKALGGRLSQSRLGRLGTRGLAYGASAGAAGALGDGIARATGYAQGDLSTVPEAVGQLAQGRETDELLATVGGVDGIVGSLDVIADPSVGQSIGSGVSRGLDAVSGVLARPFGFDLRGTAVQQDQDLAAVDAALAELVATGRGDEAAAVMGRITDAADARGVDTGKIGNVFTQYTDAAESGPVYTPGMQSAAAGQAGAAGAPGPGGYGGILAMLEDRAVGVEQDYQDRVGELRDLYQIAETPEERAQLQYALGTLEAQREAGHQAIQQAYGQAASASAAEAGAISGAGGQQAADVAGIYSGAAADVQGFADAAGEQYADAGLGVGATPVTGNVTDMVPYLEGEGGRQSELVSALAGNSASQVSALTSALGGERSAQQGQLSRDALRYAAEATLAHNAAVQDRISRERMALAGQIQGAQQYYDGRRYDLDDMGIQMALDVYGQERAAGAAGNQPIIPSDPQGAYLAGLDMLSQYGQAALPFIANNGLIPPEELALILSTMGAVEPQPAG